MKFYHLKFTLFFLAFICLVTCQNESTKKPTKKAAKKPEKVAALKLTNAITQEEIAEG